MANLPEEATYDAGVYQIELSDPVIGGPGGTSNKPMRNLANRTKWLKSQVDAIPGNTDAKITAHKAEADPHSQYATDADLTAHTSAADPHPQYETSAEAAAKITAHKAEADPHSQYATDADLTAHTSASDPHPQYETSAEAAAKITAHKAEADPHSQYATDADLAAHTAAADPHPQYETSAEAAAKITAHKDENEPHSQYLKKTDLNDAVKALGVGQSVAVDGDLLIYAGQTKTLKITNYSAFSVYVVSVTAGSVSKSGDTITFVAPNAPQSLQMTIQMDGNAKTFTLQVQSSGIAAPTLTAPVSGSVGQPSNVTLTATAFTALGAADNHYNSDWQVATDMAFTNVVKSTSADAINKTAWTVTGLSVSTTYFLRVRYRGNNNGVSAWSSVYSFTTAASFAPPAVGTAMGGGYMAGLIVIDGKQYALIVSPKSSGEFPAAYPSSSNAANYNDGASSINDGLANSNALNNNNYPHAKFCRGLTIGGYTDWYLPSRDELEILYRNLKPSTTGNATYPNRSVELLGQGYGIDTNGNGTNTNSYPVGATYTTVNPAKTANSNFAESGSEEFASFDSFHHVYFPHVSSTYCISGYWWYQEFAGGRQYISTPTANIGYARAVRRVPL